MAKIKFNKKKSQEIADKIDKVFDLISVLTDEDIEYLNQVSRDIENENGKLQSVQGLLVDYDRAEVKIKLGQQARSRIRGLVMIRNAIDNSTKANIEYAKSQKNKFDLNGVFGL